MRRFAVLVYGVFAYLVFLPAFLYLFAFVGNYGVPKSVDSGEPIGLVPTLLINAALVASFGIQHAIMARPWFKKRWTRIVPEPMERSTFVLIASLLILLICWQWRPMPTVLWDIQHPVARSLLHLQFVLGGLLVLGSSFLIDHFDLFGLRQVWLHWRGQPYSQRAFAERSAYRFVRHPLMLGFLIAFWSTPTMTVGHALFAGLFTAYILVGVRIEERDLVALHGRQYHEYRRRTPMLLPRLWRTAPARTNAAISNA